MSANVCRLCGGRAFREVLDLGHMPIAHRLLEQADTTEERFPFVLSACLRCSHLQVFDPIPAAVLYSGFNFNFSSWKIEPHFDDEVDTVLQAAAPARVLDVGANDGRWLSALAARGVSTVVGIEPNPVPARLARERGIAVHEGLLDAQMAQKVRAAHGQFDLVSARQVVEHIDDLATCFDAARSLVRDGGWLFVDVPDFAPARDAGDCSVLWEEHINYFTFPTLDALLRRFGFIPEIVKTYDFSGGTLAILARRAAELREFAVPPTSASDIDAASAFAERSRMYARRLAAALSGVRARGARTVLYGAGVRACMALNGMQIGQFFEAALDDQVERQGMFIPGARLPIRPAQHLAGVSEPVTCMLAVNSENEANVRARFDGVIGARVTYASLCAPSNIWADLEQLEAAAWN